MEKTNRNYSLDFLKILAAIGIVFHHFQVTTHSRFDNFINFHGGWFDWGYLVELFFVLSGYFMYRYISVIQTGDITLLEWWKKRALRLLPMAAITVVAFELILFLHNIKYEPDLWGMEVSLWGSVIAALGIQEGWVFLNPIINNSIWYISALMLCYLIFYVVTALAARIKCKPVYFYIAMILFGFGIGVYKLDLPFMNWQIARGYYAFFFGLVLAAYINKYGVKAKEIVISILTIALVSVMFIFYREGADDYINYTVTFLLYPAIIILFETKILRKIFCHKIWGVLSGISFEVYLWHLPMLLLLDSIVIRTGWKPDYTNIWVMFAFLAVTWIVATVMYFGLERPISKVIAKRSSKKGLEKAECPTVSGNF